MAKFRKLSLDELQQTFELINEDAQRAIYGGSMTSVNPEVQWEDPSVSVYSTSQIDRMINGDYLVSSASASSGSFGYEDDYYDGYWGGELDEVTVTAYGGVFCSTHDVYYYKKNGNCPKCNEYEIDQQFYDAKYGDKNNYGPNPPDPPVDPSTGIVGGGSSGSSGVSTGAIFNDFKQQIKIQLDKLKGTVADTITSTADKLAEIYTEASAFLKEHPTLKYDMNLYLDQLSNLVKSGVELDPDRMGWFDLGAIWLYELGDFNKNSNGIPTIYFGEKARTTLEIKVLDGSVMAKEKAIQALKEGKSEISYSWSYGQDEFYEGITTGNTATSFLGSYTTKVTITKNGDGSYNFKYMAYNVSGWESATRLRKDMDGIPGHDPIILDQDRGGSGFHLGGNIRQEWHWNETVRLP